MAINDESGYLFLKINGQFLFKYLNTNQKNFRLNNLKL